MTAGQLCAAVYVILVDRLDGQVNAVMAAGGEVDPDDERAQLDAALEAPFTSLDGEKHVLARALGVAR